MNPLVCFFDDEGCLIRKPNLRKDKKNALLISEAIKNNKFGPLSNIHKKMVKFWKNNYSKNIIESLLFCDDIDNKEISEVLGVEKELIDEYQFWFCDVSEFDTYFEKKIYIESEIDEYKLIFNKAPTQYISNKITSLLFKRWALLLGKEFVIWRFDLKRLEVNSSVLFDVIAKEAFFKYKEITLGEKELPYPEYVRIINSLVRTIKDINVVTSQNGVGDDVLYDIEQALDIVIKEKEPIKEIEANIELVNNAKIE